VVAGVVGREGEAALAGAALADDAVVVVEDFLHGGDAWSAFWSLERIL